MSDRLRFRSVETASGERESEAWSRRASAAELLFVFTAFQSALWLGAGRPPAIGDTAWIRDLGVVVAVAASAYALFLSPRLHGDGWHAIGLAEPGELRAIWPRLAPVMRAAALASAVALPLVVMWLGWDDMLIRLGIRRTWPDVYRGLTASPWRLVGPLGGALVLGSLLGIVLVRWTNLSSALRAFAWPTAIMLAAVAAAAALGLTERDAPLEPGLHSRPAGGERLLAQMAVYVPWAYLQQWVLLGYFNTRLRKMMPSAGGMGVSGRSITAVITGIAFASMHLPGVTLAAFTLASGTVWGWLFQRDQSRNLFVVSVAHAVIGSAVGALSGMSMTVGR